MNRVYAGIDVMSCVQGNTVRKIYRDENYSAGCVVYDFEHRTAEETARSRQEAYEEASAKRIGRRAAQRKKAARARARRVQSIRLALCGVLLAVVFSIGGIASKAKSKEVPDAYKYYDTITVAYQENLLDIVQRYDNRAYYEHIWWSRITIRSLSDQLIRSICSVPIRSALNCTELIG